jgi:uncharacterized membrane protein
VSATLPIPPSIQNPARRSRRGTLVLIAYVGVLAAAFASGRGWLDAIAAFMVVSLVLWPGLRRLSPAAIALWVLAAAGIAALELAGHGELALDFLPVVINLALCALFARTLVPGSEPLIARLIGVVDSPARVALPRVAGYARTLTWVWAVVLGVQALLLAALIVCAVPGGLLARFGIASPLAIAGEDWRWFLNLGSYATVIALLVIEYAFRRWYLRDIEHLSLPVFIGRLVQRWPALAHSIVHDEREEVRA